MNINLIIKNHFIMTDKKILKLVQSNLTEEQRIFIEDFLRKRASYLYSKTWVAKLSNLINLHKKGDARVLDKNLNFTDVLKKYENSLEICLKNKKEYKTSLKRFKIFFPGFF